MQIDTEKLLATITAHEAMLHALLCTHPRPDLVAEDLAQLAEASIAGAVPSEASDRQIALERSQMEKWIEDAQEAARGRGLL